LVLGGLGCGSFILSCLVLGGLGCGCFVLGCLVLGGLGCGCFILSCLVLGGLVRRSRLFGRYHSGTAKLPRLRSCSDSRTALVHGRQERVVGTGSVHMRGLHRGCRRVLPVHRSLFCSGWSSGNSTLAAVIADMVH